MFNDYISGSGVFSNAEHQSGKKSLQKVSFDNIFRTKNQLYTKVKLKILNTVEYKWPKNANGTFLWDFQAL